MPNKPEPPMNSKLRTILQDVKQGKSFSEKYPQVPVDDQILEAEKAIRQAVGEEMLGLADSSQPDLDFERINDERYTVESAYNQALYDYQTELVKTIKEWSQS